MLPENLKSLLKKGILLGLAISFGSLVISLLVGEYIVKHIMPQQTYSFAKEVGLNIFEEGENIPITLQKNVKDKTHIAYTAEFTHTVSTNDYGIRGHNFGLNKDENTYRILFLGDSMTFGWGLNDNETYPAYIEKNLNFLVKENNLDKKFEVINAGFTSGKTVDSYLVYLRENIEKFNPDLVVLNFFPYNDLNDLDEMSWDEYDADGNPVKISSKIEKVKDGYLIKKFKNNWKFEIPILRNSHLAILLFNAMERGSPRLVNKIKNTLNIVDYQENFSKDETLRCLQSLDQPIKDCKEITLKLYDKSKFLIASANKITKDRGKQLVVTIMSDPSQTIPLGEKSDHQNLSEVLPQRDIREYLEKENIDNFDFLNSLADKNAKEYFYERDGHLRQTGAKKAALDLAVFISEKYFSEMEVDAKKLLRFQDSQ